VAHGLAGLHDQAKSDRPRTHDDEAVAELLSKVSQDTPRGSTHWSARAAAEDSGISKSPVARYFALFGVQPHRSKTFKLPSNPYFVEKVRGIVGLYLSPPTNALVLCVDEKSQCQALERTQPVLPMGLSYLESVTHGYIRHGTTTLFAALNTATGEVIARCKPRHRHQEFVSFLNHIDKAMPATLDVHLIVDNYATRYCQVAGFVA
jgi:transposase